MKSQNARIFQRTENVKKKGKAEQRTYYWASFSDKDKNEEYFSATIFVRLSNKAKDTFNENCTETSNDEVKMVYAKVTDAWLKPVPGKEHNTVVWFVNRMEPIEEEDE